MPSDARQSIVTGHEPGPPLDKRPGRGLDVDQGLVARLGGEPGAGAVARHVVGQKADFGERLIERLFSGLKSSGD